MYYVLANFCVALFATCIVIPVGVYYSARNRDIPKDQVKDWVKQLFDRDGYQIVFVFVSCLFWPVVLPFAVVCGFYKLVEVTCIHAIHYFYPDPPPKKSQEDTYR